MKISQLVRRSTVVSSGLLAVAAATVFAMPNAQAMPGNCLSSGRGTTTGSSLCTTGSGRYNTLVQCTDELRDSSKWIDGPIVTVGHRSTLKCPYQGGTQWLATDVVTYLP